MAQLLSCPSFEFIDVDVFGRYRQTVESVVPAPAPGLTYASPVSRPITGSLKTAPVHKGFHQYNLVAVFALPVRR